MSLEASRRKYPAQTMTLGNGKPFAYRYYRNPKSAAMVVLLTGGIGLSDLFYRHFEWFAGNFSVLTFDYQIQFSDMPHPTVATNLTGGIWRCWYGWSGMLNLCRSISKRGYRERAMPE